VRMLRQVSFGTAAGEVRRDADAHARHMTVGSTYLPTPLIRCLGEHFLRECAQEHRAHECAWLAPCAGPEACRAQHGTAPWSWSRHPYAAMRATRIAWDCQASA
jgi:hypothetical protein